MRRRALLSSIYFYNSLNELNLWASQQHLLSMKNKPSAVRRAQGVCSHGIKLIVSMSECIHM